MRTQNKPAHISCEKQDIAKTVLMPGDPLRAKYIAENFLEDAKLVTSVRNMLGFTGKYKGKEITVMGSGMGMPSMGIYAYELYHFFDVENIIRIGTCGNPINPETKLLDVIIADKAYSEGNFAYQLTGTTEHIVDSSKPLTEALIQVAKEKNINFKVGTINTTEVFDFYMPDLQGYVDRLPKDANIVACEMEAYALFHVAKFCNKNAACIATVVDSLFTDEFISMEEREGSLNNMIEIALEASQTM